MRFTFDIMFPRLNNLSFWVLPPSVILLTTGMFCEGGRGVGWTLYPPLRSNLGHRGNRMDFSIFSLHMAGMGSILRRVNFMATF